MRFLVSIIALVAASMLAPVVDAQTPAAAAAVPSPTFSTDPRTACGADAHRFCQNETSIVGFGDDDDDDNHGHGHGHGHDDDDDDDDDDRRRRCRSNKCPQRPLTALQCLYRHRRRLSPNCAAVVAGTPYSKCQNDIARLCSYAGTDLAEIQYCITNNKVVLSNQCYSAISTQDVSGAMVTSSSSVVAAGDDPRPICGADADRFCDYRVRSPPSPSTCYSRPETGLQCVLRHYNRLQPQCKTLVAQRPLYQCRNDIAAYCQYANGELEETKWCVLHHVVLLSQPCTDALKADANAAASEFKQECLPSAQAVCPQYIGNFPVLLNCLLTNFGQLQPVCQQAIKARVANN